MVRNTAVQTPKVKVRVNLPPESKPSTAEPWMIRPGYP